MLEHPHVARAVVAEPPDRRLNRGVVALVGPSQGSLHRERLAVESQRSRGETLGGPSRPRTIVFIDTLPAELPEDDIRRGLRAFCSARGSGATLNVSGSELLEPAQARART